MSYVPINPDPSSPYARLRALEVQLVDSGEMNADLRDFYIYIFKCLMQGMDVEVDLVALETELRKRSVDSRLEVFLYVAYLYKCHGIGYGELAKYLPIFPDFIDRQGDPHWDWRLETPLRWADQGRAPGVLTHYNRWLPPTNWLPLGQNTVGRNEAPVELNAAAASFIPRSTTPGALGGNQVAIRNQLATRRPYLAPEFRPSRVLRGEPRLLSSQFIEQIRAMGFTSNPRYEGTIDEFTVRNADCPDGENCSLFITNVDPVAANSEFFSQIYEGTIFSYHKKEPVGDITTSAISLVFTTRQAAVAFYNRLTYQGMWLRKNRLRVIWNREAVRPVAQNLVHQTRVLRISGPASITNVGQIIQFIRTKVAFVITHQRSMTRNGTDVFEFGFGSIRGQSRNIMKLLADWLGGDWRVDYAPDPCNGGYAQHGLTQGQPQLSPSSNQNGTGHLTVAQGPLQTGYGQYQGGNRNGLNQHNNSQNQPGSGQNPPGNRQIGND